jgi:hypothetical protein
MDRETRMFVFGGLLMVAAGAAAQQSPVPTTAKAKLVCKRMAETGSLVAKKKDCRTRQEWERMAEEEGRGGRDLVESNRPRFGIDQ